MDDSHRNLLTAVVTNKMIPYSTICEKTSCENHKCEKN